MSAEQTGGISPDTSKKRDNSPFGNQIIDMLRRMEANLRTPKESEGPHTQQITVNGVGHKIGIENKDGRRQYLYDGVPLQSFLYEAYPGWGQRFDTHFDLPLISVTRCLDISGLTQEEIDRHPFYSRLTRVSGGPSDYYFFYGLPVTSYMIAGLTIDKIDNDGVPYHKNQALIPIDPGRSFFMLVDELTGEKTYMALCDGRLSKVTKNYAREIEARPVESRPSLNLDMTYVDQTPARTDLGARLAQTFGTPVVVKRGGIGLIRDYFPKDGYQLWWLLNGYPIAECTESNINQGPDTLHPIPFDSDTELVLEHGVLWLVNRFYPAVPCEIKNGQLYLEGLPLKLKHEAMSWGIHKYFFYYRVQGQDLLVVLENERLYFVANEEDYLKYYYSQGNYDKRKLGGPVNDRDLIVWMRDGTKYYMPLNGFPA